MKKYLSALFLFSLLIFVMPMYALAYDYEINSYDISVKVNENNTYDIVEKIGVNFNVEKHGIYRRIPAESGITDISVNEQFTVSEITSDRKQYKEIKIGDPDKTIKGQKDYVIEYKFSAGKTGGGLYFDIIGMEWVDTEINGISFSIEMPYNVDTSMVGFAAGNVNLADDSKIRYIIEGNVIKGSYNGTLASGEGLTIEVMPPKDKWAGNNPDIAIYGADVQGDGFYHIEYGGASLEVISETENIRLLMINGSFVVNPQIVVENGRTLVPVRIISEILGAKVDWNDTDRTVIITDGGNEIKLTIGSGTAEVNGKEYYLDAPAVIVNNKTYVPLRFIAEALSADVQYIADMSNATDNMPHFEPRKKVSIVVIEKAAPNAKGFTPEEGLDAVKQASAETYDVLTAYYKEMNVTFNDYNKDYDSQAITYTGENIGRYYIYELEGFESYSIFFNKYTGEIYSEKAGLPFLIISEGFINIPWLYQ